MEAYFSAGKFFLPGKCNIFPRAMKCVANGTLKTRRRIGIICIFAQSRSNRGHKLHFIVLVSSRALSLAGSEEKRILGVNMNFHFHFIWRISFSFCTPR